jgi:hypothetical protein
MLLASGHRAGKIMEPIIYDRFEEPVISGSRASQNAADGLSRGIGRARRAVGFPVLGARPHDRTERDRCVATA